jgi:sialate O-acetylesterase
MVHPLVPFAIRGAVWYQGESNCLSRDGMTYYEKKKALIGGWRKVWGQGDFPFYFVQLAPFRYRHDPAELPKIWEAQAAALAIPNTGMAVTTDIATINNIHPPNKQDVGKRLALWALAKDYGRQGMVYSGPLYKSMKVEGAAIRIAFDHVSGGLASRDGKPLSHFQIAGADKKFVPAQARIDGDSLVVSADAVKQPVAVRFGWDQVAEPNLMNKAGLPASPFRTDKW